MWGKNILKFMVPEKMKKLMREQFVNTQVSHIHGPKVVHISEDEAAVTCVVKNGEYYIEAFINHYLEMGFRHIFILDNGSTDGTIGIAKRFDNMSIFKSLLPVDAYQCLFKKYLAKKIKGGGWCLDADIDEFFRYPDAEKIKLGVFLEYLNRNRYSAVITQLLDMFSDKPLSSLGKRKHEKNLKTIYPFYDISNVRMDSYHLSNLGLKYARKNVIANEKTSLIFGGIRKTLYGNDCLLTKHSLFRLQQGLDLFPHVHFVNGAKIADISCLMLHYKLTSNALEIALQNREAFRGNSRGYNDFIEFISKGKMEELNSKNIVRFQSENELNESGFLFNSGKYRNYVESV